MSNGRTFMLDLVDACKDSGWSVRQKDKGFVVSPPPKSRRTGFETVFVFAPKDNHERKVLAQRLKSAGLAIRIEEREVKSDMPKLDTVPPPARPATQSLTVTAEPDVSTIDRIRRNVTKIADLCAEVICDLDKLEKDNERVMQLKQLLKGLGD